MLKGSTHVNNGYNSKANGYMAAATAENSIAVLPGGSECNPDTMHHLDEYIDREIEARLSKAVSWKKLEPCFKWIRVKEYLQAAGINDDDPRIRHVRELLRSNKLGQVEYDACQRKVIRLGHGDL
jgi:hypothetical protein